MITACVSIKQGPPRNEQYARRHDDIYRERPPFLLPVGKRGAVLNAAARSGRVATKTAANALRGTGPVTSTDWTCGQAIIQQLAAHTALRNRGPQRALHGL
jgi:hypothetical protein